MRDVEGRPLRSLRVSVTDRCNLRCQYCMPEAHYTWLPRRDLLTFEEIARLVDVFTPLGVDRVRLTGGEPLLRRNVPELVASLASRPALRDLALTTNGVLLAAQAPALAAAGLHRITVSLDTLDPNRFKALTRFDTLPDVLRGIEAAREAFGRLKIDTVVMRGVNDDELAALLALGRRVDAEVRFIEYMDVGGATRWSIDAVVPRREMLQRIAATEGPAEPLPKEDSAPADRFRLPDGTTFGIISSTTEPFCGSCDRSRLTADGQWYLCLYAPRGLDLLGPLRDGARDEDLRTLIASRWRIRADRGAERRLSTPDRDALLSRQRLEADTHLEMHTRGG